MQAIANLLTVNKSLKSMGNQCDGDLSLNSIGDTGMIAIAESLLINKSLSTLGLMMIEI